jgi:hypothetical protein
MDVGEQLLLAAAVIGGWNILARIGLGRIIQAVLLAAAIGSMLCGAFGVTIVAMLMLISFERDFVY